jgi:FKBP-type peptidyl-prolyl cis-trans isomerase
MSLRSLFACVAILAATAVSAADLVKTDSVVGKGKEAVSGRTVEVNYTGWLHDPKAPNQKGKQFDSSIGRGPFSFPLGAGRVIQGWDQGVAGMKVGGKRTLVIPPELGYGARGAGGVIPPNATLVFDVELLDVK